MLPRKAIAALVLTLLAGPRSSAAEDCPKAARELAEARAAADMDEQALADKEAKIRSAISGCPSLADAHYFLGKLLLSAGKVPEARDSFAAANRLGKDPRFALGLAGAEVAAGNPAEGEKLYQELLSADANLVAGYSGIAAAYRAQDKLPEAEGALRRGIQAAPKDADLFFNLGVILEDLQKTEEAVDAYRAALERRKPFTAASVYLARAEAKLGRFDQAYDVVRSAELSEPDNAELRITEAVILDGLGRHDEALAGLDAVLAAGVQSVSLRSNRAVALGKLGRIEDAAAEIDRVVQANPDNPEALGVQGWLLLQQGELERAEQALRKSIDSGGVGAGARPVLAGSYRNLSVVLERKGDPAGAAAALQKSTDLDPFGVLSKLAAGEPAK